MTKLRLAVVGVGAHESSRARGYIDTILKLSDRYDLCAICDRNDTALQDVCDQFSISSRYDNFVRMLEQEKPDVVFILVPTDGQTAHALVAVNHGCHIITEIPYALTLPMGDAIANACRAKGVKWEVAENVWRWPHEQLKHKIVGEGLLSTTTHARMCYSHGSYHGFNGVRMVVGKPVKRVLGYVQRVPARPYTNYGGIQEDSRVWDSGILEFEDDVTCLYEMPPAPSPRASQWDVEATNGYLAGSELVLYSEEGCQTYPFEDVHEQIDGDQILSAVRVNTEPPIVWENPYKELKITATDDVAKAEILSSLHRAVTENVDPEYGLENGRRDMELWIAVHASHDRGSTWIDLPLTDETEVEARVREEYERRYSGHPVDDCDRLLNANFGRLSVMWTVAGWL